MPTRTIKPTLSKTRRRPKRSVPQNSSSTFTTPQPRQPAKPNRTTLILRSNQAHEGR